MSEPASVLERFASALAVIQNVAKNQQADTGKYTYRYADLGTVLAEVKRACDPFGLVPYQEVSYHDERLTVTLTVLANDTGEQHTFAPIGIRTPSDAQALGSAISYMRRYQLLTTFGIAADDDDGRTATVAAQTTPGRRTEAERLIRESMAEMDPVTRKAFAVDFKTEFGCPLFDLPAARHGAALTWSRAWQADDDPDMGG
jgi:hypothetical protein